MKENEDITPIVLKDEMLKYRQESIFTHERFHRCPYCEGRMRQNFVFHCCGTELDDSDREDWIECSECKGVMIFLGNRVIEPAFAIYISKRNYCTCPHPSEIFDNIVIL